MKACLLPLLLLFSFYTIHSQDITHAWSGRWGNAEGDAPPSLAVDLNGNVYSAGYFFGTVDFDPGPGNASVTAANFTLESYISKIDSAGHFQWVRTLKTTGAIHIKDIYFDQHGFLLCVGDYSGTVDFDPGSGTFNLSSTGSASETFILKLTLDGEFVWANTTSGTGQKYGSEITSDTSGNIYCAGIFTGTGDFNTGTGVKQFSATGLADGFISKFDKDGQWLWSLHHAGVYNIGILTIQADRHGHFYIGGIFDDKRDFDLGPDSSIITATGPWDGYVEKFDDDGNFIWVKTLSNTSENFVIDLKPDTLDNLLITGYYSGTLDFDQGPGMEIHSATLNDTYVMKYDPDGNYVWVATFDGTSYDRGNALVLDKNGNVYTSGFFGEEVDFDPGPGTYTLISTGNNDTDDAFVSILDKNGKFKYAGKIGGKLNDRSDALDLDPWGNILVAGGFLDKGGFYPDDSAPDSLVSAGNSDAFLARWRQCLSTFSEYGVLSCVDQFTSPSGKHVWTESGTYQDTIQNVAGCDSIITIHLAISDLGLTITQSGNELIGDGGGQLFWIDCDHNNEQVGEGPTFTPPQNGNYALVGIGFACTDTSECFSFVMTGIEALPVFDDIDIYPNPAHHVIEIDLQQIYPDIQIQVFNQFGLQVHEQNFYGQRRLKMDADYPAGLYLVTMRTNEKRKVFKVIIE